MLKCLYSVYATVILITPRIADERFLSVLAIHIGKVWKCGLPLKHLLFVFYNLKEN